MNSKITFALLISTILGVSSHVSAAPQCGDVPQLRASTVEIFLDFLKAKDVDYKVVPAMISCAEAEQDNAAADQETVSQIIKALSMLPQA